MTYEEKIRLLQIIRDLERAEVSRTTAASDLRRWLKRVFP